MYTDEYYLVSHTHLFQLFFIYVIIRQWQLMNKILLIMIIKYRERLINEQKVLSSSEMI